MSNTQSSGSNIKLIKDNNFLEVIIPPCPEKQSRWTLIYLPLILLFVFTVLIVIHLPFPFSIIIFLLSLYIIANGNQFINRLSNIIIALITFKLRLNHQQIITFTSDFCGFKFNRVSSASRNDITKLVMSESQLIIYTDKQMYKIPVGTTLESEQEIEWLSQELSNWLGIPITRYSEHAEN